MREESPISRLKESNIEPRIKKQESRVVKERRTQEGSPPNRGHLYTLLHGMSEGGPLFRIELELTHKFIIDTR